MHVTEKWMGQLPQRESHRSLQNNVGNTMFADPPEGHSLRALSKTHHCSLWQATFTSNSGWWFLCHKFKVTILGKAWDWASWYCCEVWLTSAEDQIGLVQNVGSNSWLWKSASKVKPKLKRSPISYNRIIVNPPRNLVVKNKNTNQCLIAWRKGPWMWLK